MPFHLVTATEHTLDDYDVAHVCVWATVKNKMERQKNPGYAAEHVLIVVYLTLVMYSLRSQILLVIVLFSKLLLINIVDNSKIR